MLSKLKPLVNNNRQWEAFNSYIDYLINQQAKTLESIKANKGVYTGSYMKSEIAGEPVSNESLVSYYGDMIDV